MAYQNFAYLYDELMSHAPYDEWVKLTKHIIDDYDLKKPNIVDLGCGTGEITLDLTQMAQSVVGVDYSNEMLSVAMNKANEAKKDITWIQQDIKNLEGFNAVDLIVSYCDVINYLTQQKDVEKVFTHVFNSLKESGVFVFDIHALEYIQTNLIGHTFADVSENVAYIWDCYPGDNLGAMEHEITFFAKKANDTYEKMVENHFQQVYSKEFYVETLKRIGFRDIKISVDFNLENDQLTNDTDRIFIIAQK